MNTDELVALVDRARALGTDSQPPPDLLPRARTAARRRRLNVAALGLVAGAIVAVPVAAVVVRAVDDGQPTPASSNPTVVDATPRCPDTLPMTVDPGGHGFGPDQAASRLPDLPKPQTAWVCKYSAVDSGVTDNGMVFSWTRESEPRPVDPAQLPALADDLRHLSLPDEVLACTADLGPRWLLAYPGEDGLIGVVVDDYGCREVRLTDDPFVTTAGAADTHGTVTGTLAAPEGILDRIKAAFGP